MNNYTQINNSPYAINSNGLNQRSTSDLSTASKIVGYDIDNYVFEDSFVKNDTNCTNNLSPTGAKIKKDPTAGILVLGGLSLGAFLAIRHGKGFDFIKNLFHK